MNILTVIIGLGIPVLVLLTIIGLVSLALFLTVIGGLVVCGTGLAIYTLFLMYKEHTTSTPKA